MYRTLDATRIIETLHQLQRRVSERFPGAGLAAVCAELTAIAEQAHARAQAIRRPDWVLRGLVGGVLLLGLALLVSLGGIMLSSTRASDDLFGTLQGVDSAFNILVLMGASLFFLVSLEDRRKRKLSLQALHELQSIVHVIDMHQLTKDPSTEIGEAPPTESSPVRVLTPDQMLRYLDYCSEMLSLASKVAALYAQSYPDPVVTQSVSNIERTATGLSQKIWQKINIIYRNIDALRGRALS
ncbi:MAG: hypothetical protein Q7T86_13960 [Hyphomicrobiaceae bacterium]|nr:hypothetical protein [Hyphomicrobiaceae bacterium]